MLIGAGTVSHNKAIEKTKNEYIKYQVKTIISVEKSYLYTFKEFDNKLEEKKI